DGWDMGDRAQAARIRERLNAMPPPLREQARATVEAVETWLRSGPPPNLLRNPTFQPAQSVTARWQDGPPPEWAAGGARGVRAVSGHRPGVARVGGAEEVGLSQTVELGEDAAGQVVMASVRYRTSPRFQGRIYLRMRFQNAQGVGFDDRSGTEV